MTLESWNPLIVAWNEKTPVLLSHDADHLVARHGISTRDRRRRVNAGIVEVHPCPGSKRTVGIAPHCYQRALSKGGRAALGRVGTQRVDAVCSAADTFEMGDVVDSGHRVWVGE